jgi:hypothetical protein
MFDFSPKGLRVPPIAGRNYLQKATVSGAMGHEIMKSWLAKVSLGKVDPP